MGLGFRTYVRIYFSSFLKESIRICNVEVETILDKIYQGPRILISKTLNNYAQQTLERTDSITQAA